MLNHPNIVNLVEVIDDPNTDHFYMGMNYHIFTLMYVSWSLLHVGLYINAFLRHLFSTWIYWRQVGLWGCWTPGWPRRTCCKEIFARYSFWIDVSPFSCTTPRSYHFIVNYVFKILPPFQNKCNNVLFETAKDKRISFFGQVSNKKLRLYHLVTIT